MVKIPKSLFLRFKTLNVESLGIIKNFEPLAEAFFVVIINVPRHGQYRIGNKYPRRKP